jgi:hypothetical protein
MKEEKEKKVPTADISFEIGYGSDKTRFDLNICSVSDEAETQQKFNDIEDDDSNKAELEYKICLDTLIKFSEKNGAEIKEKFAEITVKNERIIRAAYRNYTFAMNPSLDFLER